MLEKLKYNNKQNGFTLMEVFVAVSILAIGVVGAFGVLPAMIKSQTLNTDKFLASQLANEGMELTRSFRDGNWLKGYDDWKTGLDTCRSIDPGGGCEVDYTATSSLEANTDRFLKKDTNGFYNYETGSNSKFKRKIIIEQIGQALNVKVEVSWTGSGSPFSIEENFYDWR